MNINRSQQKKWKPHDAFGYMADRREMITMQSEKQLQLRRAIFNKRRQRDKTMTRLEWLCIALILYATIFGMAGWWLILGY